MSCSRSFFFCQGTRGRLRGCGRVDAHGHLFSDGSSSRFASRQRRLPSQLLARPGGPLGHPLVQHLVGGVGLSEIVVALMTNPPLRKHSLTGTATIFQRKRQQWRHTNHRCFVVYLSRKRTVGSEQGAAVCETWCRDGASRNLVRS